MKKNLWIAFGAMLTTSLLAQQLTNLPAADPAPAPAAEATATDTNAAAVAPDQPTAKPEAKKAAPKAAKKKISTKKAPKKAAPKRPAGSDLRTVPLVPGPAVVIGSNVNVRAQAKLRSEVVTRVNRDQQLTVIEEIVHSDSGPDEPSAWAKISLPPEARVWVHSSFVDPSTKMVKATRLNLRSGPGENYSVLGQLNQGDRIKDVGVKEDWIEIEAPTNAYAFIAAQYLRQETAQAPPVVATPPEPQVKAPEVAANKTPEPTPEPSKVAEPPVVAPAPAEPPVVTNVPVEITSIPSAPMETPGVTSPDESSAPMEEPVEEPPPKRIVQREGFVRGTVSIQAPSDFVLISPQSNKAIDYLHTTSPNLDLRRYKGLRIVVTGEEALDERWGNTPVLTIQKIELVD